MMVGDPTKWFTPWDIAWMVIQAGFLLFWPAVLATLYGIVRSRQLLEGFGIVFVGLLISAVWISGYAKVTGNENLPWDLFLYYAAFFATLFFVGFLLRYYIRGPVKP